MSNEKELVNKVLNGDRGAFETFIKNYERLVAQIVFKMTPNLALREEWCQDIFLKAYESLSSFKFESKISTWIATIAYHTCLNHLQKKKAILYEDRPGDKMDEEPADSKFSESYWNENSSGDVLQNKETSAILRREIESLPPPYPALLTLVHAEDLSYEEISKIMKMPVGTVKNYVFRARKLLKESLLKKYKAEELWP